MNADSKAAMVLMHPVTPEFTVDLIHELIRQRDQARSIAAALENECANCWGPVHYKAISEARLGIASDHTGADDVAG